MSAGPVFDRFRALGTVVVVGATEPERLGQAVAAVREEVEACDRACSRFRDDSELSRLNAGERFTVSHWLADAVSAALDSAHRTDGLVDPTIGQCLIDLGYDRTFERLDPDSPLVVIASHVPAWKQVHVDRHPRRVALPSGVRLDLGATAKALCSDRAAVAASRSTGCAVLVSLGGDIAVAGDGPDEGWVIRVTDRSDATPNATQPGQTVAIRAGGLATSGTSARRWARSGTILHHLVDPRTGQPAEEAWRTVSVAAPSCLSANTASTAAMILGFDAPSWLTEQGYDARLVTPEGEVLTTGGWPSGQERAKAGVTS